MMKSQFAAYYFSSFYFFGFGVNKVKVLFAANDGANAPA